eukprot:4113901-Pleurochrysis_carterae.AAC.4
MAIGQMVMIWTVVGGSWGRAASCGRSLRPGLRGSWQLIVLMYLRTTPSSAQPSGGSCRAESDSPTEEAYAVGCWLPIQLRAASD